MNRYEDPLSRIGMTLACALLAQIASVMLAALLASAAGNRAWVFLGAVTWTLCGTVLLVIQTARADQGRPAGGIRPSRIALWIVSSWVWPILVRWRTPA